MPSDPPGPIPPPSGAPPVRTTGGTDLWTPPSPEHLQRLLPQYEVISMLGRGGMGAVYKGRQISLDRLVAIKLLPHEALAGNEGGDFTERFKNEARSMAKMNHPAIVSVYDFGETSEGQLYIVMEFVDATDVAQMIISQGKLPPAHALAITAHVCDGLHYAHSHGVIHRDIKPANVLMSLEGQVKIADFGLAKATDPATLAITKTNMAMGTPDFIAPEALITGVPVDHRADLYSVGVMLYQMLTGKVPRGVFVPASKAAGCDPRYDAIVMKAMQTEREDRYQNAMEIRRALDLILTVPMSKPAAPQQQAALAHKPVSRGPQPRKEGAPAATQGAKAPEGKNPTPSKKSSIGLIAGMLSALAVIGIGAYHAFQKPDPASAVSPATGTVTSHPVDDAFIREVAGLSPAQQLDRVLGKLKELNPDYNGNEQHTIKDGHVDTLALKAGLTNLTPLRALPGLPNLQLEHIMGVRDLSALREIKLKKLDITWANVSDLSPLRELPLDTLLFFGMPVTDLSPLRGMKLRSLRCQSSLKTALDFAPLAGMPLEDLTANDGDLSPPANLAILRSIKSLKRINGKPVGEFWKSLDDSGSPQITPLPATPAKQTIDLLALTDPMTDRVPVPGMVSKNEWVRENGAVVYKPDGKSGKFAAPVAFNCRDYEIELRAERLSGTERIHLDVPLAKGRILPLILNAPGRKVINEREGKVWPALVADVHVSVRVLRSADGRSDRIIIQRRDNGETLADWTGSMDTIGKQGEDSPAFAGQSLASIFVVRDPYAVKTWTLRVFEGQAKVLREVSAPAMAASVPSSASDSATTMVPAVPSAPAIPSSNDPRLTQLAAGFKARHDADAQKPFLAAVAALNESYLANGIAPLRATAQRQGALEEVTALDAESERFKNHEPLPPADLETLPASLKALRGTYRTALAKIEADRAKKSAPLYDLYLRALDGYISELTKGNKIDEAQKVKALRDDIAAQKPGTAAGPATVQAGNPSRGGINRLSTKSVPANGEDSSSLSRNSRWYEAAHWVLSVGGSVRVDKGGRQFEVASDAGIPVGRFAILGATINGNPKSQGIRDDDFTRFSGLRELTRLQITNVKVTDAAFAFLPTTPALTHLILNAVPVTDALLPRVAPLQKLTELNVQSARQFTGAGLEKLASLPILKIAWLTSTGFTDAGAKAMAGARSLEYLNLTDTQVTDEGVAGFASLTSLTGISLQRCKNVRGTTLAAWGNMASLRNLDMSSCPLGADVLPVVGRFIHLTQLNFDDVPALTDETLGALAPLSKLTRISLARDRLSGTGFTAVRSWTDLRDLYASQETPISAEGLAAMAAAFPKLENLILGGGARLDAGDFRPLAELKALKSLDVSLPALDDAAMAEIAHISSLEYLYASNSAITAKGLAALKPMKFLTRLRVSGCKNIGDSAIPDFKTLKGLKELEIRGTAFTEGGIAALRKALPQCKVTS